MSAYVNVNGAITDAGHAVIPVDGHGFLYGDGGHEVLRTYDGAPFLFDRHMTRLRESAARIHLSVPFSDDEVERRSLETLSAAGLRSQGPGHRVEDAYIRVLVTRGVGDITYDPAACPTPSLVIIVKPLPVTPAEHYQR